MWFRLLVNDANDPVDLWQHSQMSSKLTICGLVLVQPPFFFCATSELSFWMNALPRLWHKGLLHHIVCIGKCFYFILFFFWCWTMKFRKQRRKTVVLSCWMYYILYIFFIVSERWGMTHGPHSIKYSLYRLYKKECATFQMWNSVLKFSFMVFN